MIRLFNAYFPARTLLLGASEVLLVTFAFVLATVVRFGADTDLILSYEAGFAKIALASGIFMMGMYYFELYDTLVLSNRREILTRLLQVLGAGTVVLAVVYYAYPEARLGRGIFLLGLFFLLLFFPSWRELFFFVARSLHLAERCVIVGNASLAAALTHEVQARPEVGIELVGYVDDCRDRPAMNGLRYLGGLEVLPEVVRREGVDRIIIAMGERRGRLPLEQLLELRNHGTVIQDGTELHEMVTGKVHLDSLRPSGLVFSSRLRLSRPQVFYKRVVSLFSSLIGLVLTLPLMVLIAIAIRLDSPGPLIFYQDRVGKDGKRFTLYKFRSMRHDANPDGKPKPALENDTRFTRVGRWLRRTRLDELPQLYNILKGDMDLVGPRPFVLSEEKELVRQIAFYSQRWSVKPGATGWAQVHRPYCATMEDNMEKLSYDLFYIKNMSSGLDLIILFQTLKILMWGRGAR